MKGFAALLLLTVGASGVAQSQSWQPFEYKDEMRGTVTKSASVLSKDVYGRDITLNMQVIDKGDSSQATVLTLSGAQAACDEVVCDVDVRFGDGRVRKEEMSFGETGTTIIPTSTSAFSGAIGLSKTVFIEIPLKVGQAAQFKFEIEGAPFPRVQKPSFKFAGISLGESAGPLSADYKPVEAGVGVECREAKSVKGEIPGITIPAARLCFVKDMLWSVHIETASKSDYAAVAKYMTQLFGKKGTDTIFDTWPAGSGKLLDQRPVTAKYWPLDKSKGVGRLAVTDEAITLIIPM